MPAEPPDFLGAFPLARPGVVFPPKLGRPLRPRALVCVRAIACVVFARYCARECGLDTRSCLNARERRVGGSNVGSCSARRAK